MGSLNLSSWCKKVDRLPVDRGLEGGFGFEAGQKFAHGARIEQCTGERVLADFAGFLEDVDIFFAELRVRMLGVVLVNELGEAQSARHACRTAADDDCIGRHLGAIDVFGRGCEKSASVSSFEFQVSSFEWTNQLQAVLLLIGSESISPFSSRPYLGGLGLKANHREPM